MSKIAADPSGSRPLGKGAPLVPQPGIWLRASIWALLVVFILIGQPTWLSFIGFCLTMAGFLGTFPRVAITAEYFDKEWFVCFVPIGISRTRLANVVRIETDLELRIGMLGGCILSIFVGVMNVLFVWLLDWLIPWAGGDYKLWFRMHSDHSDERVLVWQGNGESNFRENLDLLEEITGLPVTRG